LQVCLSGCCICFIHMLQISNLDVAYVLQWFISVSYVFLHVFQTHVSRVSSVFRRMLRVLCLDVSKVDLVLHLSPCLLLPRFTVSFSSRAALHPSQTMERARRGMAV
jgi:hypothetical protein